MHMEWMVRQVLAGMGCSRKALAGRAALTNPRLREPRVECGVPERLWLEESLEESAVADWAPLWPSLMEDNWDQSQGV